MSVFVLAAAVTAAFSFGEVKVDSEDRDGWKVALEREVASDGAEVAKISLDCPEAKTPRRVYSVARSQMVSDPSAVKNPSGRIRYSEVRASAVAFARS